jgi:hypothetical protein
MVIALLWFLLMMENRDGSGFGARIRPPVGS